MNRVQRKRIKGFKLPSNTKCVDRTTKWGNPFKLEGDMIYINAKYRRFILDPWVYYQQGNIYDIIILFRSLLDRTMLPTSRDEQHWVIHFENLDIEELRQYDNLACFCSLESKCHADVYIDLLK